MWLNLLTLTNSALVARSAHRVACLAILGLATALPNRVLFRTCSRAQTIFRADQPPIVPLPVRAGVSARAAAVVVAPFTLRNAAAAALSQPARAITPPFSVGWRLRG